VVLLTIADVLRMVLRPVSASLEGPTPILILDMYSLLLRFEERLPGGENTSEDL
jgi:hypothetical protein